MRSARLETQVRLGMEMDAFAEWNAVQCARPGLDKEVRRMVVSLP
jgi:hypothetical protein